MRVTVEVAGADTHELDLADPDPGDGGTLDDPGALEGADGDPTYADLVRAVGYSPHEVSVLVDGRPVPEDQPVDSEHVTVLRLIRGG